MTAAISTLAQKEVPDFSGAKRSNLSCRKPGDCHGPSALAMTMETQNKYSERTNAYKETWGRPVPLLGDFP